MDLTERLTAYLHRRRKAAAGATAEGAESAPPSESASSLLPETPMPADLLGRTLDRLDVGLLVTDARHRVVGLNEAAERVTGWPAQDAVGRPFRDVWKRSHQADDATGGGPDELHLLLRRGVAPTELDGAGGEATGISRRGELTPLRYSWSGAEGANSLGLLAFVDRRRESDSELMADRLAAMLDAVDDATIGLARDGTIVSWNLAAERLFGRSRGEMLGLSWEMLVPAELLGIEADAFARARQGLLVPMFETRGLHASGQELALRAAFTPLPDAGGQLIGIARVVQDERARRRADEARATTLRLAAENRQEVETTRLKSAFMAKMSHELRTPLNAIIGFADLMSSGLQPLDEARSREFLAHIAASGRHLLQIVSDMLDLSRLDADRVEFWPEVLDLRRVLRDALAVMQVQAEARNVQLTLEVAPGLESVQLDPGRLRQVVFNYLSNALKFTDRGGRVVLRARPDGATHWRLEVQDSGIGIPAGDLPLLFQEFSQLHGGPGGSREGTGLGLALTRRLVEAQGGRVGVHSQPGIGSVFHAVLPLEHTAQVPATPATVAPVRACVAIGPGVDEARVRRLLGEAQLEAQIVPSRDTALALIRTDAYRALSVDLSVGDAAVLELMRQARDYAVNRVGPALVLSVTATAESVPTFSVQDLGHDHRQTWRAWLDTQPRATRTLRVLVVDDDPDVLHSAAELLREHGLEVDTLADGDRVIDQLDAVQPDVMILDLVMPRVSGFEVLDRVRSSPQWHRLPVVVWSNKALTDLEYLALARQARAVLSKVDVDLDALARMLTAVPPRQDSSFATLT